MTTPGSTGSECLDDSIVPDDNAYAIERLLTTGTEIPVGAYRVRRPITVAKPSPPRCAPDTWDTE